VLKLRLKEDIDRAIVDVLPATMWFPVVDDDNINEIQAHVIAWIKKRTESSRFGNKTQCFLRADIHTAGMIYHRAYLLKGESETSQTYTIKSTVDMRTLYPELPSEWLEDEPTNCSKPLVIYVPNLELDDETHGVDDYSEADTLFQELDIRLAQIARVLDKHTDPSMYGPPLNTEPDLFTGKVKEKAGGRYFEIQAGDATPGMIVWDAELDANFKYLEQIMRGLYIATDTNETAFSFVSGGSVPSGSALKRLLMRPLARTNRKRIFWDSALKLLFATASELEANNSRKAPTDLNIRIEWKDGLPEDPVEQANIENIRTGAKATSSVKSAIRRLDGGTEEEIEAELAQIEDERESEMPAVPFSQTVMPFGRGQNSPENNDNTSTENQGSGE
jgi:hypothetical protein